MTDHYDAGVNPHASDRGLYRRDRQVLSTCAAAGVPVACVIGGGYDRDLPALVRRHALLYQAAATILPRYAQ